MSKLIQSQPGMVQVVDLNSGGAPGVLSIEGNGKLESLTGVVITSIGVNQQVNIQFAPSLQKIIYAYSFGDRMGAVEVSGIAFNKVCQGGNSAGYVGASNLFKYYDKNRAVNEGRLMKVSIGKLALQGFLTSSRLSTASPEFKTMGFTLEIVSVPKQE